MALTAIVDVSLSNDGKELILRDDTVYGDGVSDPSRAQSLVNFTVTYKASGGDVDIPAVADPAQDFNAIPLEVSRDRDGYYEILMVITHDPDDVTWGGPDYNYGTTEKRLVQYSSNSCYANMIYDIVQNSICGCENKSKLKDARLIKVKIEAAKNKCDDADMPSAQLITENIEEVCNCENC